MSSSGMGKCPMGNANAGVAVLVAITAIATYYITKQNEEAKHRLLIYQQYQREKEAKEKLVKDREKSVESTKTDIPTSGEILEGVSIEKVYVWSIEDLRKRFVSANVENYMKNKVHHPTTIRSPLLRHASSWDEDAENSLYEDPTKTGTDTTSSSGGGGDQDVRRSITLNNHHQSYNKLITDDQVILADVVRKPSMPKHTVGYMRAGPRARLHFDPKEVSAAIVTCGGLCPGLNNVIREITKTLHQIYGIEGNVYGLQGGYRGFYDPSPHLQPMILTPELVEDIHHEGGTVLGSSRGGFDLDKILNFLREKKVCQLYVIGGDGTHRGAFRIHEGCMEHGMNVSVAGIPKTIDNDVNYIDHSFGFASAVEAAQYAIRSAKTEAVCNLPNGIGIVKLMGRSAGFIAAHACMSSSDVDLCLVPEVPIVLEGEKGCLPHLYRRVKQQGYAVIVCAEGAGEELLGESAEKDASGNKKLPKIGEFMKQAVVDYFQKRGEEATVKYIDPSYTVRSVAANASDSLYCMQLAQNAVHGAMAGFTGFTVGLCNNRMVWLPIPEVVATSPRSMNPRGRTWERVLSLTRQPNTVEPLKPGEKDNFDSYAPMLR